jgi:hypothetical protein
MKADILEYRGCYYTTIIINNDAYFIFSISKFIPLSVIQIYSSVSYSVDTAYKQFKIDLEMKHQYYSIKENHKPL